MRRRLRLHAAAADEATAAAAWYERQRPGLGTEFMRAVDAVLDLLEQTILPVTTIPEMDAVRRIKRLKLRRFPYAVVVQERDTEILVIAFAHQARRPGYWRARLRG